MTAMLEQTQADLVKLLGMVQQGEKVVITMPQGNQPQLHRQDEPRLRRGHPQRQVTGLFTMMAGRVRVCPR
jgi:hypothetical protein